MKYIIQFVIIGLFACVLNAQAQQMSDTERLALTVWVPDNEGNIPPAATNVLENKLTQIATQYGITGSTNLMRFILTANIDVLTKDFTATAPVMQSYTLSVNMYIADGVDGKAFSSYSTTVKGVGENETKAYLSALKNLRQVIRRIKHLSTKAKGKSSPILMPSVILLLKRQKQWPT